MTTSETPRTDAMFNGVGAWSEESVTRFSTPAKHFIGLSRTLERELAAMKELYAKEGHKNIVWMEQLSAANERINELETRLACARAETVADAISCIDGHMETCGNEDDIICCGINCDMIFKSAIRALAAVPPGYACVPVEPTPAMIQTGDLAYDKPNCIESIYKAMLTTANERIAKLNDRLENNHYFDKDGNRHECEPGEFPDGISCRDETIALLKERIKELETRLARANSAECRQLE